MSNGEYHTVFDVTVAGYKSWSFPAFGLLFIAFTLVMPVRAPRGMEKWFRRPIFAGFAIFWTSIAFIATYHDYRRAVDSLRSGQADMIEGVVTQFHPLPYNGRGSESFVVQGVKFKYADNLIIAGFNKTASHGGPICEGLPVKIWHLNGEILRLDIKNEPDTTLKPTLSAH